MLDYYKIGQRIRKYRKANGISQEALAETVNISVTHMSHIETGNTKLSLQVLTDIAECLKVPVDILIHDNFDDINKNTYDRIISALEKCSASELLIIEESVVSIAAALKKHR